MCDLTKNVPDTQAGPQSVQQPSMSAGGSTPGMIDENGISLPGQSFGGTLGDGGKANLGTPQKKVNTKFGSFLKYALPALQGAAYGAGSAEPTRALGGSGFGASLASAMGRVGAHQQQQKMLQYHMGLEGLDRQMRLATLQNTVANQQATQDWHRGNLEARLKSIEDSNDKEEWTPVASDQGIFEVEKRSGKIRPATPVPDQGQGSQSLAPTTPGGDGGGATSAAPNVQGNVPPGMFSGIFDPAKPTPFNSGSPRRAVDTSSMGIAPPSTLPGAPTAQATVMSGATPGQLTRSKTAKHSRGEVKYDEGIPTGVFGDEDKIYRAGDPKLPDDLKAALGDAMNAHKTSMQDKITVAKAGAAARGESMGRNRPTTQYDTQLGITRTVASGEAEDHPERYHVASYANIVDTQQKLATINELDKNIDRTNKSADAIKAPGLTPNIIAAGLADPSSDLGKQFQGGLIKNLKPAQRDVINYVRNLRQGITAYKNIMSSGGVTDARINLLEQEMPGIPEISSGDPKIFRQKLKAWTDIYTSVRDQYKPFFEKMLGKDMTGGGSDNTPPPGAKIRDYTQVGARP